MFEYWSFFILAFFGFMGLGFLIYLMGNRKSRFEKDKFETYTCGEPFPKTEVSPQNFYVAIKKNLGIREMRDMHSGKLSDYLLWFLIGLVAVMIMVMFI